MTDIQPGNFTFDAENIDIEDVDLDETEIIVDGKQLTEERATVIAADVLAQARTATGLIPGGKSLSGGSKHSPVIQTRVSEVTRDKLQAIAAGRNMSVSKLSRQVLDEFVASQAI